MTAISLLDEEAIARRSRIAAWASIGGFLLIMGTIALGVGEIRRLEDAKGGLKKENEKLAGETKGLNDQRAQLAKSVAELEKREVELGERIERKQAELAFVSYTLATGKYDTAIQSLKKVTYTDQVIRVYFHLQSAAQQGVYHRCKEALMSKPYQVQPEIMVKPITLKQTDIRYFKRADRAQANVLAEKLSDCVRGRGRVRLIDGYETSTMVRAGQFEVWFASNKR